MIVIIIFVGITTGFWVYSGINCSEIKEEYQTDPILAFQNQSFETFEEWTIENEFSSSRIPSIGQQVLIGG